MADRTLRWVLTGEDRSASKTLGHVAEKSQSASHQIGSAFSKLGGMIGGEFGNILNELGSKFDEVGEKGGRTLAQKVQIGGAAMLGAGAALTMMGAREKQATDQLNQSIEATGHSAEEFDGKVESTVHHMEKFGYTAVQTKDALTTLTNATHDPQKALDLMGEAADYAAVKHISLNDAATALARGINGSAKMFKQFGVTIKTNADGTKDYAGANEQLARILHGQASAAADNFGGRLRALRAEVEDGVASFGQKYGPAITAAGAAMTLVGPLARGVSAAVHGIAGMFSSTAEVAVAADEAAAASTTALAGEVEASATSQLGSFSQVAGGAQGASGTAIAADEAAEASTENLAAAVQGSAGTQVAAFAQVAGAAQGESAKIVAADDSIVAANEAAAASGNSTATSSRSLAGSLAGVAGSLALVGAALYAGNKYLAIGNTEAMNSVKGFAEGADHAKQSLDELQTAIVNAPSQFVELSAKWAEGEVKADGLATAAAKSGVTIAQLTAGITGNDEEFNTLIATWQKAGGLSKEQATLLKALHAGYLNLTGSTKLHTEAASKDSTALKAVAFDANALSNAFSRLNNHYLNAEQSALSFKDAEYQVVQAVKQNGHSLDENTVQGRANREAVLQAITAAQDHANAVWKQTHSAEAATRAFDDDRAALKRHLLQIGLNKDEVQRLVNTFAKIPALKKTTIDNNADAARAKVAAYKRIIETVPSRWITDYILNIQTGSNKTHSGSGGHQGGQQAGGTDFAPGGGTLVAERETEVIDLPRGSTVTPLSKMRGGQPAQVIELHYHAPLYHGGTNQQLARALVGELEAFVATGGKLTIADGVR